MEKSTYIQESPRPPIVTCERVFTGVAFIHLSGCRSPFITILWLCVCERDRTGDEGTEQIELFVITAYPNTGKPAIILPTLGMTGGKWDSSLCCFILQDGIFPPSLHFLTK